MEFNYKLVHCNRKTFGLIVERDKSIIIRAPNKASSIDIRNFLNKKRFWLYSKLKHSQKYKNLGRKEFISGAAVLYMGRNYKLDVTKENFDGVSFNNKFIISKSHQKKAKELFKDWYINRAKDKITRLAKYYANTIGVDFNSIKIFEPKYRWGSCTPKNNLTFNWKLLKAPLPVIKYVIVHELAHLRINNHTPRFWNIIKTQLPDYRKSKEWLRDNGHLLEVDF